MKRNRKTLQMGTSTPTVGTPPTAAVFGGYGGPGGYRKVSIQYSSAVLVESTYMLGGRHLGWVSKLGGSRLSEARSCQVLYIDQVADGRIGWSFITVEVGESPSEGPDHDKRFHPRSSG